MYTWLENLLGSVRGKKKTFAEKYWKPFGRYIRLNNREIEGADNGYWSRSREEHAFGQFSYAVVQANASMEDFSQVEVGLNGTFAGVYDGHGGHEAAWFVLQNLFTNLIHYAQGQRGSITESVFRNAFSKTEGQFIDFADLAKYRERNLYGVGSCCLTVLIWNKTLFVCHLGDSRAVLGRANKRKPSQIIAEQLSRDHNVNLPDVRREVQIEHEEDPIVVRQDENNVWRIKGIIQISRAIGDLYLKDAKYSAGHTRERITKPVISTDPEYHIRAIEPTDMFVILASDGLWEHLDNQEAVDIVAKGPRADIAKKLIKAAMKIAARKQRRSYRSVRKLATGARRPVHDDISVIVLFIDQDLLERSALVEEVSWQAFFSDGQVPSEFRKILGGASSSGGSGGAGPSGGGDGAGPSGYGGGGDGAGPSGYGGGGGGDGAGPSGYGGGGGVSTSGGGGGVNTSGPGDGSSTSSSDGENSSGGGEITEAGDARGKAVMEG